MNEKELALLEKCINTVSLKPYEIEAYVSMCNKLNEMLTSKKEEKENDI